MQIICCRDKHRKIRNKHRSIQERYNMIRAGVEPQPFGLGRRKNGTLATPHTARQPTKVAFVHVTALCFC